MIESKVLVNNISRNTTQPHLVEIFSTFGEILYIDLILSSKKSWRSAYIKYKEQEGAISAIKCMHGGVIDGMTVSVVIQPRNPAVLTAIQPTNTTNKSPV